MASRSTERALMRKRQHFEERMEHVRRNVGREVGLVPEPGAWTLPLLVVAGGVVVAGVMARFVLRFARARSA